jgi:hypothetical protein
MNMRVIKDVLRLKFDGGFSLRGLRRADPTARHGTPRSRLRRRHGCLELYICACRTGRDDGCWFGGIARALSFYGGVPQLIVLNSTHTAVAQTL